jgi:homoserine kinase
MALDDCGDVVTARHGEAPGVRLAAVRGDDGRLPRTAERNTAGVAARALLAAAGRGAAGVELELDKGLPLASGLGSSAASAVAAVVAVDALLGLSAPAAELLAAALEGERAACGAAHPDNAAPSLLGGLVLCRQGEPLELPVPSGLGVAVVHPRLSLATAEARARLGRDLPLATAVAQWADLGAFVHALHTGDLDLLARSLVDRVAEPVRAALVPGFAAVRAAALAAGALGASLSGSGPSTFALVAGAERAPAVAAAMLSGFATAGVDGEVVYAGAVPRRGARVLADGAPSAAVAGSAG